MELPRQELVACRLPNRPMKLQFEVDPFGEGSRLERLHLARHLADLGLGSSVEIFRGEKGCQRLQRGAHEDELSCFLRSNVEDRTPAVGVSDNDAFTLQDMEGFANHTVADTIALRQLDLTELLAQLILTIEDCGPNGVRYALRKGLALQSLGCHFSQRAQEGLSRLHPARKMDNRFRFQDSAEC